MVSVSKLPGGARLQQTTAWRILRHKISQQIGERTNSHFTGFLRLPTQFAALTGPVVDGFLQRGVAAAPCRIAVLGCSNGSEAYTIISELLRMHAALPVEVEGFDLSAEIVVKAQSAVYETDEVLNNRIITNEFIDFTFDRAGDSFRVKPAIAERASFRVADVLSSDLLDNTGQYDIVFAQNFIFHMKRRQARHALERIMGLCRPGTALFLDGVDLDLRQRFARRHSLQPLDFQIEEIHNEARRARGLGWPDQYWGLEPYLTFRRNATTRYATVFLAP